MALPGISEQELKAIHELGRTVEAARFALVVGMGISVTDYSELFQADFFFVLECRTRSSFFQCTL